MNSLKSKTLVGLTLVLLLSLIGTIAVFSQTEGTWPFSSDPESGLLPSTAQQTTDELGLGELQPDDIGYDGPVWNPEAPQGSSADAAESEAVDWEALMAGPQPDNDAGSPEQPEWSSYYYVFAAGSTLKTRDSAQNWANSASGGCIYATTLASEIMNLHLDIPTGSGIDYLRIFYYDTNAANSSSWITTYDGDSGFADIATVSSSGTGGYSTDLSPYIGHVVDNGNHAYVLNWRPNVTGNTMMLCGLRVAYRLP